MALLMDAVPSGSYLVMAHAASDITPEASAEMARRYNEMSSASITPRTRDQVARFFDGLELLTPRPGPGDLCDAVASRAGGQAMLERIERAGLFLLPLD